MISEEVQALFQQTLSTLGAPIRKIQLTEEQMCDLLKNSIGLYSKAVNSWVVKSQWMNLYGKDLTANDITYLLTARTLDMADDYAFWFSKEIGLQQRGKGYWELKKDFFKVEAGKQNYVIPAGREINRLMYVTPTTSNVALMGNLGGLDGGFAYGLGQFGNMGMGMGLTGFYIGSMADSVMMSMDLKMKNQMLRGDLCYKITAGPDGTHIVHLLSTPGSHKTFGGISLDDRYGWGKLIDSYVWYSYYDVNADNVDECRRLNKNIIISPDQVPLEQMKFELLNDPAKQTVRQLFLAECMRTLAFVRGTYSGKVSIMEAEANMDYNMFMNSAEKERDNALEELKTWLEDMSPDVIMRKQAEMTENMIKIQTAKPMGFYLK